MKVKAIILGGLMALGLMASAVPGHAAGKTWNGCGVGGNLAMTAGMLDAGGPIGIGSTGPAIGVTAFCDVRYSNFVVGAEANYDWFYGNLSTLGVKNDLTLGGRAGALINSETLLYGHLGWTQIDTDFGKFTGYKVGPGIEFKLPGTPLYVDARYSYASYDVGSMAPGINAETHTFRFGAKFKFGPEGFSSPFADEPTAKAKVPCDAKRGDCR